MEVGSRRHDDDNVADDYSSDGALSYDSQVFFVFRAGPSTNTAQTAVFFFRRGLCSRAVVFDEEEEEEEEEEDEEEDEERGCDIPIVSFWGR